MCPIVFAESSFPLRTPLSCKSVDDRFQHLRGEFIQADAPELADRIGVMLAVGFQRFRAAAASLMFPHPALEEFQRTLGGRNGTASRFAWASSIRRTGPCRPRPSVLKPDLRRLEGKFAGTQYATGNPSMESGHRSVCSSVEKLVR